MCSLTFASVSSGRPAQIVLEPVRERERERGLHPLNALSGDVPECPLLGYRLLFYFDYFYLIFPTTGCTHREEREMANVIIIIARTFR
jgi:hypothetical protein